MIRSVAALLACTAIGLLGAGPAGEARAATAGGVTMPDTMQVAGHTLVLNGMGVRSFTLLHIRGYVGGLYLTTKADTDEKVLDEPGPKALLMHFIRGAPAAKVHDLYMNSSTVYCEHHACNDQDKVSFEALLSTVQDVKPGDTTTFLITDQNVTVQHNGTTTKVINDPAFGRVILDSDLGTTAPSAELRDGLLGKDQS